MKNLTSGNIRRQLVSLALPLILGSILQQFYNTIDALVVGRYAGSASFAAIGVAGTVMNLFVFVINGFCTGISIILAGYYGCQDWKNFRKECFVSLTAGCVFTLFLSLLGLTALIPVLRLIQTPAQVAGPASTYLTIIFAGLAATFLYNFCSAVLRAAGDTAAALLFLAAAICANLVLDLIFIALLGLGIAGAAWATLLSQLLSVILCLIYMARKTPGLLFSRKDMVFDLSLLTRTCNYCFVTALHQSSVYIGKLLVQGAVNSLGTETIAAYTAAGRLEGFSNSFGDSGGAAISVFIAQNDGRSQPRRARHGFITGTILMTILGVISSLALFLWASPAAAFMLKGAGATALSQCVIYLRIISVFYTFCFIGNSFVGYFEGHGRMLIPVVGAAGHITLRVILSYAFVGYAGLPVVAAATGAGWMMVVAFWGILCLRRESSTLKYGFNILSDKLHSVRDLWLKQTHN